MRVRALRAAGMSRPQIKRELGIGSATLQQALLDGREPAPRREWKRDPAVRARAVEMRLAGATYPEIAETLDISRSTCSLWLRHLPAPQADPTRRAALEARRLAALRVRLRQQREARDAQRDEVAAAAASRVGEVTTRDLVLAAALSYWCEGSKRKPWNRNVSVTWLNSDPFLVLLFLEGLAVLGVRDEQLRFRVQIHESADEPAARRWWADVVGVPVDRFGRSTLKRHNPRTIRKNVGAEYHGCLSVSVVQSGDLYDRLRGVVAGLTRNERTTEGWHDAHRGIVGLPLDDAARSALV